MKLTVEELRKRLQYEPATGRLYWLDGQCVGNRAGSNCVSTGKKYRQVNVSGMVMKEHKLIWYYVHGEWASCIDHINGNGRDNRLVNLRSVSRQENQRNMKKPKSNTSGHIGVTRKRGKWRAYITIDRKQKNLGTYSSLKDAVKARKDAERLYGFHPNHGR